MALAIDILVAMPRLFFYSEAAFTEVPLLQPVPSASTVNKVNPVNLFFGHRTSVSMPTGPILI